MAGRRALILVGVLLLQVAVLAAAVVGRSDGMAHGDAVALVAPPVVGAVLADRISADDTTVVTRDTEDAALDDLRSGSVEAVVVVDLTADGDRLLLSPTNGPTLDAAIEAGVEKVSASLGRTVTVEPVDVPTMGRGVVAALVIGAIVLGFVGAVAAAWRRGPTDDVRSAVGRDVRLGVLALAAGVLVAVLAAVAPGPFSGWWLPLGVLLVWNGALATTALTALFGAPGIGVSSALFLLTTAPLLSVGHVLLLSGGWSAVTPRLPHGAGLDVGTAVGLGAGGPLRAWLVLVAWAVLATFTAAVARRARVRAAAFGPLANS